MNAADREAYLDALGAPAPAAPAATAYDFPRVTFTQAARRPRLDFVLPGLLAGTVGMIVGQGAVGKSMLSLQIGMSVAAGLPVAGGLWTPDDPAEGGWTQPAPGLVTIVAGEDGEGILQERKHWLRKSAGIDDLDAEHLDSKMRTYAADGYDLRVWTQTRDGYAPGPFFPALREMCAGQRLVVLDPLVLLHDCPENDNTGNAHFIRTLKIVAKETGSAIVVLHHVGKSDGEGREAWMAARGASALTTSVRWQLNLAPPSPADCDAMGISDEARREYVSVLVAKANYGLPPAKAFLRRGQGGILAHHVPAKSEKGAEAADDGPDFQKDDPRPGWREGSVT